MFKKINLQFIISYLGLVPFLIVLSNNFFYQFLDTNIMKDFIVFYSLIIFVFIGANNWNLKKNISFKSLLLGFVPSFLSIFVILIFLHSYDVFFLLIIFFVAQLIMDYFNYTTKLERNIFLKLRVLLTILIVFSLLIIQL